MRSTERNTRRSTPLPPEAPASVIGRASVILGAFTAATPTLSLAALVRHTGLPKTTVHRLAAELVAERLLDVSGGGYRLGLRCFELGELVPRQRTLREAAIPFMEDLRAATGHRVHLAVLDGVDVVYVEILGGRSMPLASRTGGRLPAHATGVGKAMLAFVPSTVVRARVEAGLSRHTPRTIITPGALAAELATIRAAGLAFDREESTVGVSCVAAPLFGPEGVIGAISVTGTTTQIDLDRLGPAVRTASLALSRQLGSPVSRG